MDWTPELLDQINRYGGFVVIAALYIIDRLVGEPRRYKREETRLNGVFDMFRAERAEDRKVLMELASAVSKLEQRIDGINQKAA